MLTYDYRLKMDLELDYPDDDLDAMLDDELEVRKEMEQEQEMKENVPSSPTASLGGVKHIEANVGIGSKGRLGYNGHNIILNNIRRRK